MMRNPILLLLALLTATALHAQEEDANLNVIVDGTAAQIDLSADYPFATPEEFTATHVTIHRNVAAGTGTFCLPFEVSAEEIGANAEMGTYYEVDGENQKVLFEKKTGVGANTPFLMRGLSAATALHFDNKTVEATPASLGDKFVGNYGGTQSAEGKWGIANATTFMRGGAQAKMRSFQAYLTEIPVSQQAIGLAFLGDPTGIDATLNSRPSAPNAAVYDLQGRRVALSEADFRECSGQLPKGIYLVNGKKVIVK